MKLSKEIYICILEKTNPTTYIKLGLSSKFLYDYVNKKIEEEYKKYKE